ncbi:MAG TPA: FxsA family protein [Dongiaceae bacterium]|nr:FxsA family protein [Dongiaceae bacterium]
MMRWIGLLAFALPFLEIAGFVWIGSKLGLAFTLIWVLGAMVAGLLLLRRTGMQAVGKLRAALADGTEPGHSLLDAACFTAAAMLLIVPGFFSDALALLLMLPMTRHWLLRRTAGHFETRVYRRSASTTSTIDGSFTVVSEEEAARDPQPTRRIEPTRPGGDRPVIDVE